MSAPADRSRTYVLISHAVGRLLGAFEVLRPEPHQFDCGYVLARAEWGKGLMTEVLAEVNGWAMRQGWHLADRCRLRRRQPRLCPCYGGGGARTGGYPPPLDHSPE